MGRNHFSTTINEHKAAKISSLNYSPTIWARKDSVAGFLSIQVEDIYGGSRFIDFALQTSVEKGCVRNRRLLIWHVPDAERIERYEDDLLRQDSLIHQAST